MVNVIDYVEGGTFLHRMNPVAKLALAAGIIVSTFLANGYPALLCLPCLTIALAAHAGAASRLVSLLKVVAPLALLMLLLQAVFVRGGDAVLGPFTVDGLVSGSKAALRLVGVALPLVLVLAVTRLNDLANACVEVLRIPYRYAFAFTTALRFVPLLGQEMDAIMEAQTARGVEYDTKSPFKKLRLMLPLCAPLLISSVAKTDACALAAEQRGFYLRDRSSAYKRYPMRAIDMGALFASAALIALGAMA